MTLARSVSDRLRMEHAYLRRPAPLHFAVEQSVPETQRHFQLRTALFLSIRLAFRDRATVTSDQFLYWDPTDPSRNLAPDVAVRLGGPTAPLDVWKTWELGAPQVAVEIVSEHDRSERQTKQKLEQYRRAGVAEVVRFDPEQQTQPLRLFDVHAGDLLERDLGHPQAFRCDALGLYWTLREDPELGRTLRLAYDVGGTSLVFTPEEAERAKKEAALARVRELEAELARTR